MKEYILSVICAAVLCAIVGDLAEKKGTSAMMLKLICGVFLSFTVIRPITEVKLGEFSFFTEEISQDAFQVSDLGQTQAYGEMSAIISREITAYILDKAAIYSEELAVDVVLDEHLIPRRVILSGRISPMGRAQLEEIIEMDLGIAMEDQIWNE